MPPAGRRGTRHVAGGERESIFQPAVVAGRRAALRRATAAAGGTCTASAPAGSSRCSRWRPSSASRNGCSAWRCTASPADGAHRLRLRAGRPLAPRRGSTPAAASPRSPRPTARCATCTSATASPPSSPLPSARARRWCASTSRAGRSRCCAAPSDTRVRPGRPRGRRADRVPDRGRAHGARLLLRAAQRRASIGEPGDAAAAARDQPRRPDRRDQRRRSGRSCSTGPSAASPWSTSTTAAASGYGRAYRERLDGAWGVVDVDDVGQRGALPGRARRRRPEARLAIRGAQRRRLHDPGRARLPRLLPGRRQPLRHQRPRDPGARHPQVRVALPRLAGRSLPGRAPTSTASARRCTSSSGCRAP